MPVTVASLDAGAQVLVINEVMICNSIYADEDGEYPGWVEVKNRGVSRSLMGLYLTNDTITSKKRWAFPDEPIGSGGHLKIWLSGKNRRYHNNFYLVQDEPYLALYDANLNRVVDVLSLPLNLNEGESYGRFPDGQAAKIFFSSVDITPGARNRHQQGWQKVVTSSEFSIRDNSPNACLSYDDHIWLLAGEVRDENGSWVGVTDVWKSRDGVSWDMVTPAAPFRHVSMFVVFQNKMWAFDGKAYSSTDGNVWKLEASGGAPSAGKIVAFNDFLINVNGVEVRRSYDGITWQLVNAAAPWPPRILFNLVDFNGKIWMLGGGINYGTGNDAYYQDVWSSADGINWTRVTDSAPWNGRIWFTTFVYDNKIWLAGGYNHWYYIQGYQGHYGNFNDVWYTTNGKDWQIQQGFSFPQRHGQYTCLKDGYVYVVAGYGGGGLANLYNDVWRFSLRTEQKISVQSTEISKVYGDPSFDFQLQDQQIQYEPVYSAKPVVEVENGQLAIKNTGRTEILITALGDEKQYPADTSIHVSVTPKVLLMFIANNQIVYGDSVPELRFRYEGFAYNDTEEVLDTKPSAQADVEKFPDAGVYDIFMPEYEDDNYIIIHPQENFYVFKRPLVVTPLDKEISWGEKFTPEFSYQGFVFEENESVLDELPAAFVGNLPVGIHTFSISGGIDNNYSYVYNDGLIAVKRSNLQSAVYPNPSGGRLSIVIDQSFEDVQVQVFSSHGEVIADVSNLKGNNFNFDFSSLKPGIYHYRVTGSVTESSGKFFIK